MARTGGPSTIWKGTTMKYLIAAVIGLSLGAAALAQQPGDKQLPDKKAEAAKCPLHNCCGCMAEDGRLFENKQLQILALNCWRTIANYNVTDNNEAAHA